MPAGCPKCQLSENFEIYKAYAIKEIEAMGGFPAKWSIDHLLKLYDVVCGILSRNKDAIADDWSVTFSRLALIVQQERNQIERELAWEVEQKIKAAHRR